MTAPVLAVGDGPLGFCKPLRETFPEITSSAMSHKMANVLAALPKSAQPRAGRARRDLERRNTDRAVTAAEALRRRLRRRGQGGREDHR